MNCDYKADPCPFCGCTEIEMMKIYDTGGWYLRCGNCRIETPVYSTLQSAIKNWNRRVLINDPWGSFADQVD